MPKPVISTELSSQQQLERLGYKQELSRSVTTFDLLIYGLIFMVPIAPWAIFGTVYNEAQGMVPLVYLVGLVAMIFTALSYAQMAKAIPLAGSVFSYVGRGIHPNLGFFAGWLMLLDYLLVPTLLYVFAAESMIGIFPDSERWMWALLFVAVNVVINMSGVSSLKWMNRVFLVMELVFIVAFFVIGIRALTDGTTPGSSFSVSPLWDPATVSAPLLATALSIAVLSFLGFDGISTMAEESTGGRDSAGRAMVLALVIVATLFITQTWLASLLAGPYQPIPEDRVGNAFFDIIGTIASTPVMNAFFVCNVLAVGIANAMAAQAATSRLLYSMSRDGQLPKFLKHINTRKVPSYAILFVGGLSAVLVLFFVGQISLISSMVNFGALTGFLLLHLSVVVFWIGRRKSRNYLVHLVFPVVGFAIIGYVLLNAETQAKVAGMVWIGVGVLVFAYYRRTGRSTELAEDREDTAVATH